MELAGKPAPARSALSFLAGGGEMGERLRAFDWAATPLGPVESWPQSLRSAVSIMLPSRAQIALFWGPELVTLYNDAYRPVFGAKHPHALGLPIREAWSELWGSGLRELFEGVLATGEAYWAKDRPFFLERFGFPEETFFDVSYDPVREESGRVGGVFCIVSETTDRVVGERRLRTLRELSARTVQPGTAEEACRTAAAILASDRLDLPFALLYLLDDAARQAHLAGSTGLPEGAPSAPDRIDLAVPGGGGAGDWPFASLLGPGQPPAVVALDRAAHGSLGPWPEAPHTAVVLPVRTSGHDQCSGFLVAGISPRRPLDDAYRGFLDLLAGQIAIAVANARAYEAERRRAEALAQLDAAKTVFFSNVSHEFRTPLTLVLGPLEDALSGADGEVPPALHERLEVVHRNGLRLQRLVNMLLEFSRIEAGRARAVFEPVDLAAFTSGLASAFRSACERAGLRLLLDCPPLPEPVHVDRALWEQVVLNLLSNAFKFTREGEIAVCLRAVGEAAELSVRDTGTGIPEEELPRVFDRFHRIENPRARTHEGSGIGLALVHEVVRLHGGSIVARSRPGEGTTFVVTLPFGTAHLPEEQVGPVGEPATVSQAGAFVEEALRWLPEGDEGRSAPGEDGRPRVLVADDNADMRAYVRQVLETRFQVETVADGREALAAARERPPDLVLTDVMMPRLDGFGLLRELRADPRTRELPVLLLSARAGEESRIEGLEAAADDYLVKPFTARELLARVTAHVQTARLRRERGQAQDAQRRLAAIVESSDDAIIGLDLAGHVTSWNGGAERLYGYAAGEVLGRPIDLLMPPDHTDDFSILLERFRRGERVENYETVRRTKDGRRLDVALTVSPLRDAQGRIVGASKIARDITRRKRAEEALREADRRKDEFLATLAHELRNPLAPIRNAVHVLISRGPDDPVLKLSREVIQRQAANMARLVEDLLDVSRITRNSLTLRKERVTLASVVEAAVETSRPLIDAGRHDLQVALPDDPVLLDADPVRLAQVLANLLNNAARYSEDGGRIRLEARREGNDVVVSVRDTGLGIDPAILPDLFRIFSQGPPAAGKVQGGLGIGLALARGLAELHGGSLRAHSEGPGKGSTFTLRLPVADGPAPEGGAARGEERPSPVPRRRILVVDDLKDSADSLASLLRVSGHEVHTAYDGEEALRLAAAFRPDVAILDLRMPGLDGYETCRRIRREAWGAGMTLLALTGQGQVEDRRRSREAGYDVHLVKPVSPQEILKLVAELRRSS